MEDLINKIQTSENLLESLNKLGDELRQESNRIAIHDQLSVLIPHFNKFLLQSSTKLQLETLRVLINILANNDSNRDYLTNVSGSDLHVVGMWGIIKNHIHDVDDVVEFIFIFLNQFIFDTHHKEKYLNFLYNEKIQEKLYPIVTEETWDDIGEFVYELLSCAKVLNEQDERFLNMCFDLHLKGDEEGQEENQSVWVDLLGLNKPSNDGYKKVLQLIPNKKSSLVKRKLFALTSELAIDDESLDLALDTISKTSDSYVFAACCITVGNAIHDAASYQSTYSQVEQNLGIQKLVSLYFNNKITDVVQIQSIHLWNNLLDEISTKEIIKNYQDQLLTMTKIVIDNKDYYKEILPLYYKFIKKLIKLSTTTEIPQSLINFIFENDKESSSVLEIKYLLLQLHIESYGELIGDVVQTVNTNNILEQLKTIAMINTALSKDKVPTTIDLHVSYLMPLLKMLSELSSNLDAQRQQGTDSGENWQFKAIENNLKFVAASTIGLAQGESNTDIINICNDIIQKGK